MEHKTKLFEQGLYICLEDKFKLVERLKFDHEKLWVDLESELSKAQTCYKDLERNVKDTKFENELVACIKKVEK